MKGAIYLVSTHGYFDLDHATGSVRSSGLPDTGGQTVYCVELARALGKLGHPTFLVTRWFDIKVPELEKVGPNAWILRVQGGPFNFVPKEEIYPYLPHIQDNLASIIRDELPRMFKEANLEPPPSFAPVLFHGHYVDGGIVAQADSRAFHVPFFWTSHSLGALKQERMIKGGALAADVVKCNFGVRTSEELRIMQKAARHGGMTVTANTELADIKRLYDLEVTAAFIPPGVDARKFRLLGEGEEDPEHTGVSGTGPIILMGGRFARTKGFEQGLMAFNEVLQEFPSATMLIFGGSSSPTPEEAEVQGQIQAYREKKGNTFARKVFLRGAQPQDALPALYRAADVFIMPSTHEPFGMVSLEAAACGIPVVASSHSGFVTEFQHLEHCRVADPNLTQEFAGAIKGLLRDKQAAQAMAARALAHVNDHYTWGGIARKHLKLWREKGAVLDR